MFVAQRILLLLFLVVVSAQCSAAQPSQGSSSAAASGKTFDGMVDVGGRRLHLSCAGRNAEGRPTVILESGFGSDASVWNKVQPEVAKFTRVCSYDRAGLGTSEAVTAPRTIVALTEDLHALLQKAKVSAPYVLVGHSLGGMLARMYASYYPSEVVGMVFVDSAHEDENDRGLALLPPDTLKEMLRKARPEDIRVAGPESVDTCSIRPLLNALDWRGQIPLVVLTQGLPYRPEDYPVPSVAPKYYQLHLEMQKELASRSTKGRQVVAAKSGHFIHQDEPGLVVDAVRQVVEESKLERAGAK